MDTPQCWKDVQAALDAGIDRLLLTGPPGTGKSYAGLFHNVTGEAHRLACTEDMTTFDLLGGYMPTGGDTWSWNLGKGIAAWDGGDRLVLDEVDRASGDVLSSLLLVTDTPESASWKNPDTGETHRPQPGFSVVATTNLTEVELLDPALADRFPIRVNVDQIHPNTLAEIPFKYKDAVAATVVLEEGRRVSIRAWKAFLKLVGTNEQERAAVLAFGPTKAEAVLDAIKINGVDDA